jgi:2-keto-4-pentenoate hydratase
MRDSLAKILIQHRASGILIGALSPDVAPQTVEHDYRIQNDTIAALGPLGAWKVQPMPASGEPFTAPILAHTIFASGATLRTADFPGLGIEVEVAVTINRALPALPQGYSPADMQAEIGSMHIALELLASRFVDRKSVPQLTGIADLQSTGGIVLGAVVPTDALPELGQQHMTLSVDGREVAATPGNATTDNVLAALAWLANHTAARGLPLKAGDVVITGARLGPVPLTGKLVQAQAPSGYRAGGLRLGLPCIP